MVIIIYIMFALSYIFCEMFVTDMLAMEPLKKGDRRIIVCIQEIILEQEHVESQQVRASGSRDSSGIATVPADPTMRGWGLRVKGTLRRWKKKI